MLSTNRSHPSSLVRRRERWFYLLIAPWIIGFVCFQAGPLLAALGLAFVDWPLPQPPRWVGLQNLQTLAHDPLLLRTLLNTLTYALGSIPTGLLLALLLALLLQRPRPGVSIFRLLFFLPVITAGVALTLLWAWMFNPRYGPINQGLALLGIAGPAWLQDERWAMPALILMSLWGVGVNMVVYLAALQGVPADLHEAAALDGAGRRARLWHITLPLISPITFYLLVVNLIGAFQLFTPTYILTRGGPNNATLTLPLYIYLNAFAWGKLGYASALALVLLVIVLLVTALQFRLAGQWVHYRGETN